MADISYADDGRRQNIHVAMLGHNARLADLHRSANALGLSWISNKHRTLAPRSYGAQVFEVSPSSLALSDVTRGPSSGIEILGIDFPAGNPDSGFVTLQTLDNVDESLHVFSGSALLTKFGDMRLLLKTIENPDFSVELQNPSHNEVRTGCQRIKQETNSLLVV
jgi:hypothetical protein